MGKGGGGGGPQQVTQTTSNLPEYARPYFEDLLGAGGAQVFTRDAQGQVTGLQPYQRYENQRIEGFNPAQQQTQQNVLGMQTPGQFGTGTGFAEAGGMQALQAGQYQPGQFMAPQITTPGLRQFQAQGPGQIQGGLESFTGQGTAEQFMSPYMQQVVDTQKRAATREAQIAQQQANLGAARQGTYGGARQALGQAERERGLLDRLSSIQATGSQAAFDAAQKAFEQEQARRLQGGLQTQQLGTQTGLENLRARLGVQQLGTQTGLEASRANQQAIMDAQRLAEQSRQFGGTLGLQGAEAATRAGATLGQLGQTQQAADLQRLQAQAGVGAEQQALQQRYLDQAYADFLRQRDYPMEQLGYYSNLLRGLPMQLSTTQTSYAPPPSFAAQAGGLGLAGLSLGKLTGAFAKGGLVDSYAAGGSVTSGPSPEELHRMGSGIADKDLGEMQNRLLANASSKPADLDKLIMVAGELQARKDIREKAATPKVYDTPYIAELLTDGAMPPMPQQVAMLPENAGGVAALPAPNMENMEPYTAAAGGLVAFEDGGQVARFDAGGMPFYAEGNRPFQTAPGQRRREYTQEELDEFRRLKELGVLGGAKELGALGVEKLKTSVIDPVTEFFSRGSGRQDLRAAQNQAAYGQNVFTREGDPSGAQYSGIEDVPFSTMAPVASAIANALPEAKPPVAGAGAAPDEKAAGIPTLGDALRLGRQFAGDTKDIEKQLKELPTAEKAATEQFDLYKKMGVDLDPYKSLKANLEKEKSEEGKAKTEAGLMALANFGFSLATQTGPLGQALGKAGKETLPMYAAELKDLKKLSRERDRTLADIKAIDSKMRKDVTDAGLAKLEKRREKLEGRMDQINDNAARISGTIYGQQLASQTAYGVAGINKTTAEAGRAEARDDRLLMQAQEIASKQVRDDPKSIGLSASQKEDEIKRLAASLYRQALALREGKTEQAPAGTTLRFDAKGNPIQ